MTTGTSIKRDIDGGYAWVIFTGCFIMYLLVIGTMKCYGVLYAEMLDYFQAAAGEASWIGSLNLGLAFCTAPFANALSMRFSFRAVTFVGGLLIGIGLITSAFVPSARLMYLTFGAISGIGYGLCIMPCVTILILYFERRRAVVTGVVIGGSGCGIFVFPHLYRSIGVKTGKRFINLVLPRFCLNSNGPKKRYLFESFGFRGACLVLGGVMLNVCCVACCFRQPAILVNLATTRSRLTQQQRERRQITEMGDDSTKPEQGRCYILITTFKPSLFKQFMFTMYCLGNALAQAAYYVCVVLIPIYVQQLGYSKTRANEALFILGGSEIFGRIVFGVLVGKLSLAPSKFMLVIMIISAPLVFITPFLPYFAYAAAFSTIVGLLPGSIQALNSLVVIEATGINDFPKGIGIVVCCIGVATLVSQRVIGLTHDLTGSWDAAFMISAILMLVAAACYFLPHLKRNATSPHAAQESGAPTIELEINEPCPLQAESHM